MSRYGIEVKIPNLTDDVFLFNLNRMTSSKDEQFLSDLSNDVTKNLARYFHREGDCGYLWDTNAIIGYDENMDTWFFQAFEITIDDSDTLFIWLGIFPREFHDINMLLKLLYQLGIHVFMTDSEFNTMLHECDSLGGTLFYVRPFEKNSFDGTDENHVLSTFNVKYISSNEDAISLLNELSNQ